MEDVSRRRREAIRGVFTEMVNDINTELRDPLIDKSGIYEKFDKLESLHLELLALNERCQAILLAKDEATDDEIDREFEECEPYITERYYLKTRIRIMREQDRDAQVKSSQIPPGASSASPNSDTDNQKVIKLQNTSTSLSKSPEESVKNEIEGVEKEDSVKTARAVEGGERRETEAAVKSNKVKDSETAVDGYVGVKEAEAKDKAKETEAKPDKVNSKDGDEGDEVKESEGQKAGDEGDGKNDSEVKPKYEGIKDSEDEPKGDGLKDSEDEPKGDGVKDSKDEPKGDGVKDSKDEPKGDGVNDSEARPTEDTESKIKNKGKDHDENEAKNMDAEQGTDSTVGEKLDAEQGTDSKVEENPDAEQGTESRMEEGIIDPKDWFKSESRAAPIRPVFGDASCRGRGGLSLRRYLKRRPILLRRIPEIGIKLRKNKYGDLADMGRYFQVLAIKENDWDYLRFLWKRKMDAYGATSGGVYEEGAAACRIFSFYKKERWGNHHSQNNGNGAFNFQYFNGDGGYRAVNVCSTFRCSTHHLYRQNECSATTSSGPQSTFDFKSSQTTYCRYNNSTYRMALPPLSSILILFFNIFSTNNLTIVTKHCNLIQDHRTISRRLVANGLHSCRPLRRLPLTPPNRRQRLEWCRTRSMWMTEWHRVVFSDESRFCLSSDSRRVRVWRRRGERSNPAAIVERPTVRQRGIMVWGAIAYDSRSPLLRIQSTMTAQRYVDDMLRPVTLPYLQGVPNALYQQDNARPHTARISQQALQDVQMFPWPPYSSDLSPIEHVWDIIGRRFHALPQPRSEEELWQMVEREWRAIPQDAIRTLIDSLPRRVAACIAVRGGPTCY
ncbi:Transposase [Cordylochernes scorpioides]|uniref:Transposase n=1 Tax=Cordylochernes scorpioides TaxID=51811 RepID=A0ABY6K272_9ARAC|nr:Transposase [Cordylochernes scorpioides]